jgi:hypothetical protein
MNNWLAVKRPRLFLVLVYVLLGSANAAQADVGYIAG